MATVQVPITSDLTAGDAPFRASALAVHDAIIACGWTQTADTGQINFATVTKPGATGTVAGYAIYKSSDALSATKPIYLKLEFGTGNSATQLGFWLQFGTSTTGAGVLTGQTSTRRQMIPGAVGVGLTSYFSGDGGRIAAAICVGGLTGSTTGMYFSVERSHADDGSYDGTGFYWWRASNASVTSQFIPFTGAIFAEDTRTPAMMYQPVSTGVYGTDTGVYPQLPFLGKWLNPLTNFLSYYRADISAGSQIPVRLYGVDHNYITMGPGYDTTITALASPAAASMMMRYE